jgi:hypothetical protein|tara:strand:- start:9396 stop:9908 length:513 start_codon:yes stop_codon:yes gene_type:complete
MWMLMQTGADGSKFIVDESNTNGVVFEGGCRCGAVQYASSAQPSSITLCHCRACQQLSGSAYIPFTGVPKTAFKFTKSSSLQNLKLSDIAERTFCSSCGTPLTMEYKFDENRISVTMGSVDSKTMSCELPTVKTHIYLSEKAPWVVLPEDGTERWGTMETAHLLASNKTD